MGTNGGIFHCGYSGKTEGPRYEVWREQYARRWLSGDFEPLEGDHLINEVSTSDHSFLSLCNMRSTPVRIERRSDASSFTPGVRYLILASSSPLQARQRGRSIELSSGTMALLSGDEPAQVVQLVDGDRWSIRVPQKLLGIICGNVDEKIARPINATNELTKLLLQQIDTAHRFGSKLDASANHTIAQHVLDLIALCLGGNADAAHLASHRGLAAARLDAVKAVVLRRLSAPDMTLARIAAGCGLSTRYVQYLFESAGTSFTAFVLEHRLLLAYRQLCDPINHRRKVSDVANTAGFSDVSYFNRAFRRRFGATPSDVRANGSFGRMDARSES